jgi:transposase
MEKIKSDIEPLGTWCPDCKAEKAYEIFMRHLLAYTTLMRCASCRPKLLHGGEWQCQRCSTRH